MSQEISITRAVEELQKAFILLNDKYFNNELEKPIITLHRNNNADLYGWITTHKVWSSKAGEKYREINLSAEHLHRDAALVITTLLHEMCHLFNMQAGVQDTNDTGFYHNKEFKKTAERFGLIVEKSAKYGFCITRPSQELTEFVRENIRAENFDLARPKDDEDDTKKPKGKKQSMKKYSCPACGLIIRASKDISGKVMCVDCEEILLES